MQSYMIYALENHTLDLGRNNFQYYKCCYTSNNKNVIPIYFYTQTYLLYYTWKDIYIYYYCNRNLY